MMKLAEGMAGIALLLVLCLPNGQAQTEAAPAKVNTEHFVLKTFTLTNISQTSEALEIVTAIRNMLTPASKAYFVPTQNALFVEANPDQLQIAEKIIAELDRPRKSYRLTYTINESEGGKRIGSQHFSIIVVSGQRTNLKQGSKVPIVTGSYNPGTPSTQTQVTYIDIGLNLDATLDESVNGVRLRTKAEQSGIADGGNSQDPVVRQTILEGTSILTPGKPLVLGSLDIPGSTRHQEIEVVMEVVK